MEIIAADSKKLVEAASRLAYEIWREHYVSVITPEQIEYMLENFQTPPAISRQIKENGYKYFLMKSPEGSFEGYFAVVPQEKHMFLSKIYVRKQSRGKGYARKTIEFIKELARAQGCKSIFLTVNRENSGSVNVYKKMGFKVLEEVNQEIGGGFFMNDYIMGLEV